MALESSAEYSPSHSVGAVNKTLGRLWLIISPVLVVAGIAYGAFAAYWDPMFLMLLAPYGMLLGIFWHRSLLPFATTLVATSAGAISFPIAEAFC